MVISVPISDQMVLHTKGDPCKSNMGSHQKKEKNFTTSVKYGGGVSKFWCVNLKKVFFRANFAKFEF